MKIKYKVFKNLTGEPAIIQDLGDRKLEIYWMNDTPYYSNNVAQGRFTQWTSNGKEFKLLIEKEYYETVSEIYSPDTSKMWVNYLANMGKIQFKYNIIFYSIALVIMAVMTVLSIVLKNSMFALIGLIVIMVLSMVQNGILRKKVQTEGDNLQLSIMQFVGEENFREIIRKQEAFYQTHYSNQEPEIIVNNGADQIDNIENEEEKPEESNLEPEVEVNEDDSSK